MEVTVHRYRLRPGLSYESIPNCFPNGAYRVDLTDNFTIDFAPDMIRERCYKRNDDNTDLFWFWITDKRHLYDNDDYLDLIDNWCRTGYRTVIEDKEQFALIQAYNTLLDNITWLIRDESLEKKLTYEPKEEEIPKMSVYELNQQAYRNLPPMTDAALEEARKKIADYMEQYKWFTEPYFILLCRELNDYTMFKKLDITNSLSSAKTVFEILQDRGTLLDVRADENNGNWIEAWVKYKEDGEPHMYAFFEATDFVIEC